MTDVRIVLVDDHPVFRMGLGALIQRMNGIEIVGEAEDAASAMDVVRRERPDVVIMDVHLPDATGVDATAALVRERPDLGVLVLTMFDDDDSVHAAMRAGARGYLLKGARPDEIERAILGVANGELILGAAAARSAQQQWQRPYARTPVFPELSEREHEVLGLVAAGLDNRSIASRLVVSEKTVRNHVSNVFTKLGVASRAEAIVQARKAGLVQDT